MKHGPAVKRRASFSEIVLLMVIRVLCRTCFLWVFMSTADSVSSKAGVRSFKAEQYVSLIWTLNRLYSEIVTSLKHAKRSN